MSIMKSKKTLGQRSDAGLLHVKSAGGFLNRMVSKPSVKGILMAIKEAPSNFRAEYICAKEKAEELTSGPIRTMTHIVTYHWMWNGVVVSGGLRSEAESRRMLDSSTRADGTVEIEVTINGDLEIVAVPVEEIEISRDTVEIREDC